MSGHCWTATAVPSGRLKRRQMPQLDGRSGTEKVGDSERLDSHTERMFRRGKRRIGSTPSIGNSLARTQAEDDVIDLCPSPTHAVLDVIDCSVDSDSNGEEGGCAFPCMSIPSTKRTRLQRSRRRSPFTRNLERRPHGQSREMSDAGGSIRESRSW